MTTDYVIISAATIESLQVLVQQNIKIGWEPIGGLCYSPEVSKNTNFGGYWKGEMYTQAMIKKVSE